MSTTFVFMFGDACTMFLGEKGHHPAGPVVC